MTNPTKAMEMQTNKPSLTLKPLNQAPKDGTPIVAVLPISDEGDFLKTIFWTQDGDAGYWDTTESEPQDKDNFLGYIGTADEVYTAITGGYGHDR